MDNAYRATLFLLKLVLSVLQKQDAFMAFLQETSRASLVTTTLDVLLRTVNPTAGEPDYLVRILRCVLLHPQLIIRVQCDMCAFSYLDHVDDMPEHCFVVARIVSVLNSIFSVRTKLLKYFCFKAVMFF